jgi:hypothetical protein
VSGPNLIGQDVEGVVMASNHNNGIIDGRQRTQEFSQDRLMRLQTFNMIWNPDDAIRFG